jgi:ADP-ribose pyrophosphatase YjhB (NUDIX family)
MKFDSLFRFCPVCGSGDFHQHNVKSKKCIACGFNLYVNPAAAVAVFIINTEGELLVSVRGKEPVKGTFDLPGGFVDEHETAEEAVYREIQEELGVEINQAKYLFSLPNEYLFSGWTTPTLDLFYLYEVVGEFKPVPADDVAACFFVPLNQLDPASFGLGSVRKAVGIFIEKRINIE